MADSSSRPVEESAEQRLLRKSARDAWVSLGLLQEAKEEGELDLTARGELEQMVPAIISRSPSNSLLPLAAAALAP